MNNNLRTSQFNFAVDEENKNAPSLSQSQSTAFLFSAIEEVLNDKEFQTSVIPKKNDIIDAIDFKYVNKKQFRE